METVEEACDWFGPVLGSEAPCRKVRKLLAGVEGQEEIRWYRRADRATVSRKVPKLWVVNVSGMSAEQILVQLIDADPSRPEARQLQTLIRRY